jgi:integrase/recombinase XerD
VEREIARWLDDERWEDVARSTHRLQRIQIHVFRRWLEKREVHSVRDISREVLRAYVQDERDAGRKASTIAVKVYVVRSWLRWLADEGLIPHVPRIRAPRRDIPPLHVPTVEQIEAVVKACNDGTPQGYRDGALILTLYGSGCRVSDAAGLDLDDLDLDERSAHVRAGKGDKPRTIWLTGRAADALRVYVDRYRQPTAVPKHARAVFTTRVGTRISTEMIRHVVTRRGRLAGLEGLHPHLFRHAAATHMLDDGAGLRHVQELLGHSHIASTQRYTHLSSDSLRRTVERFHPHSTQPPDRPTPSSSTPDPGAAPDRR